MRILNFFCSFGKKKTLPVFEKNETENVKKILHRKNLNLRKINQIKDVILENTRKEKAIAIVCYTEDIAEDEKLMSLVDTYGHIADVFFVCCKKMSKEEYQHDILNYFLDKSVQRTNLIYYLFKHRAKDIKFGVWERMINDERFHKSIYHFFEKAKKDPECWAKLVTFFQEKKFVTVPCSTTLESYVQIEKELFQH